MPLKKTTTNKPAPFKDMGDAHGASSAKNPPGPLQTKGRVIQAEASTKPSGAGKFTAPRKEPSKAPFDCGYTKP